MRMTTKTIIPGLKLLCIYKLSRLPPDADNLIKKSMINIKPSSLWKEMRNEVVCLMGFSLALINIWDARPIVSKPRNILMTAKIIWLTVQLERLQGVVLSSWLMISNSDLEYSPTKLTKCSWALGMLMLFPRNTKNAKINCNWPSIQRIQRELLEMLSLERKASKNLIFEAESSRYAIFFLDCVIIGEYIYKESKSCSVCFYFCFNILRKKKIKISMQVFLSKYL